MKIIAVIPARLNSTRLPNKLLRDICGKTLIRRTYEATKNSSLFDDVLVVTNSEEILKELKNNQIKFLFDKNQKVSLQQTGLDDNSRYYYEGDYKIVSQTDDVIVIECSLSTSDGTSSPTYLLEYNIDDDSFMCTDSSGGPNFIATKKL